GGLQLSRRHPPDTRKACTAAVSLSLPAQTQSRRYRFRAGCHGRAAAFAGGYHHPLPRWRADLLGSAQRPHPQGGDALSDPHHSGGVSRPGLRQRSGVPRPLPGLGQLTVGGEGCPAGRAAPGVSAGKIVSGAITLDELVLVPPGAVTAAGGVGCAPSKRNNMNRNGARRPRSCCLTSPRHHRGRRLISTRRFCARPSGVLLLAIGWLGPTPRLLMRAPETPWLMR